MQQGEIHGDFETYSVLDVRDVGAFKYFEHPSTEILMFNFAFNDDEDVTRWNPAMGITRELREVYQRVENGETLVAHNAMFEFCGWNRIMVKQFGAPPLRAKQLRCTAAKAAMCGYPRSLEKACAAARVKHQKDKRGTQLINIFCKPRRPTKNNPATRIYPEDNPEAFEEFCQYCDADILAERDLDKALPNLPAFERNAYLHDFMVNERGLPIDLYRVKRAIKILRELERRVVFKVRALTEGINPTQVAQLLQWINDQGESLPNMQAKTLSRALLHNTITDRKVRAVIRLRMEASKVSNKKLLRMASVIGEYFRARGTILFYGAHTGRASGRLIQPQNFVRGLIEKADQIALMEKVLAMLADRSITAEDFEREFKRPLHSLAQCMRGFIRAKPGNKLVVVDYAQIEARVLVWLAEQNDAVREYVEYDAGRGHDRYVLMAAYLWHIKPEAVSPEQRRIAKQLVLGCGFGLGWKKFIEYCEKEDIVIDEEMSQRAVKAFRTKHQKVKYYWYDVEKCALAAIRKPGTRITLRNISFFVDEEKRFLRIKLPSGRELFYPTPRAVPCLKFGKPSHRIEFRTEIKGQWLWQTTYGGKLVENIVQGIARDIMVIGGLNAERAGFKLILWVHDELVAEVSRQIKKLSAKFMELVVCDLPAWIGILPIKAEGFEAVYYRK